MRTTMLLCLQYYNLWAHYRVLKILDILTSLLSRDGTEVLYLVGLSKRQHYQWVL